MIKAVIADARENEIVSADCFPQWKRTGTRAMLSYMRRQGYLELVKIGTPGRNGSAALYRIP